MNSILSDYYFSAGEVAALLILISAVVATGYWACSRRWRRRTVALRQELEETRSRYDREYLRSLHDHLQSAVAHEFLRGLDYISSQSAATLDGLSKAQQVLRDKQQAILVKTYELEHRARNLLALLAAEEQWVHPELLNVRRVVEHVLLGVHQNAQDKGVTMLPHLEDVEPAVLSRDATSLILENLVHNAIKYSFPGGAVQIALSLERDDSKEERPTIYVEVKDSGRGIPEEEQERIFQLRRRGDGLLEPGSGLGLYLARQAARRQGGDVFLARSRPNEGSTFRATFPAADLDLEP